MLGDDKVVRSSKVGLMSRAAAVKKLYILCRIRTMSIKRCFYNLYAQSLKFFAIFIKWDRHNNLMALFYKGLHQFFSEQV